MAIQSVLINVADVSRSVDFYVQHLGAVAYHVTAESAVLDLVTAKLRLTRVPQPAASTWIPDDHQKGFRHVGFKVSDMDKRVTALKDAGVRFHLEPIHAEGDVRITFFYDPDGTLLELVEGPLQYHEVYNQEQVEMDWGMGEPTRPRFDHVAETVADVKETERYFAQFGYTRMAGIHQPEDPNGFEINFLRSGDSSLEIFTFDRAQKSERSPQLDSLGFAAIELDGPAPNNATEVGIIAGQRFFSDCDGLLHAVVEV